MMSAIRMTMGAFPITIEITKWAHFGVMALEAT
jgi:hypothetical protein